MTTTHPATEMDDAIEHLYRTFAGYGAKILDHSPHVAEEGLRDLYGEVRERPADAVSRFGWRAMTTIGDVEDFKHFLPRIFELIADDAVDFNAERMLGGKLRYADFESWPEHEREAVRRYLVAAWRHRLHGEELYLSEPFLHGLASVGGIEDALRIWRDVALCESGARRQLAELDEALDNPAELVPPFWQDELSEAWTVVLDWFTDPVNRELIELGVAEREEHGY